MNAFENDVRLALYRFFADEGRPPVPAELVGALSAEVAEVESAYRVLHEQHVIVLAPGTPYVWMANPFSALPTPYRTEVAGKTYWGNCVWDALGIVAMLGGNGRVVARCGDCAEQLVVDVTDGRVDADPYIVHYAVPAAHWWDDIGFN